ncbi:hypothetical protein LCGC14_2926170 [marine sediment metagenome]|uniref:Uncharacterized protein n=1 Tax=marine sediment metagenome TaxID=412755 RepID=A0A0F8XME3_9ZZZZ
MVRTREGDPGQDYVRPCPIKVHDGAKNANVWVIECDKPTPGVARIAKRGGGALFKYGGELRIQIAGDSAREVELAMGWFLKTFPSAEIRPTIQRPDGADHAEHRRREKEQKPYVLNPITLAEAVGQR